MPRLSALEAHLSAESAVSMVDRNYILGSSPWRQGDIAGDSTQHTAHAIASWLSL